MEEKLKIRIPKETYDTLLKDCEAFEFYKPNQELNKNAFLCALINNYYEAFQEKTNELYHFIQQEIKEINDEHMHLIVNRLNTYWILPKKAKYDSIISIKPTKDSIDALNYIESFLLKNTTLSEFFRNMLTSYAHLPQDQREIIIFKNQYETIKEAISKKKRIYFTTKTGLVSHNEAVYAITTSKEELHCYVLSKAKDTCRSYRLSRIKNVILLKEKAEFSEEEIQIFERMITYGPQFSYIASESTAIVFLTENGKRMFHDFYVHRPIVDKIEGNLYYFKCSHNQVLHYFKRFGKHAKIISPIFLKKQMIQFLKESLALYEKD